MEISLESLEKETPAKSSFDFIRQPEAITQRSFEIIEAELMANGYRLPPAPEWAVVRRVIHSTADFDFAENLRFHPQAIPTIITALQNGAPIVTDARMVEAGLNRKSLAALNVKSYCYIDHPAAVAQARAAEITVSMAAMRLAAQNHAGQSPIFAIGNAPTALFELLDLVQSGQIEPAAIIGLPVGFVSVVESKEALRQIENPAWITTNGRKGGSSATVGALNALMLLALEVK